MAAAAAPTAPSNAMSIAPPPVARNRLAITYPSGQVLSVSLNALTYGLELELASPTELKMYRLVLTQPEEVRHISASQVRTQDTNWMHFKNAMN